MICDIACIEMSDPRSGCGCSSYLEFKSMFPEWANRSDIERSMGTSFWNWPNPFPKALPVIDPTNLLVIPENWPKCENLQNCEMGTFNDLAC